MNSAKMNAMVEISIFLFWSHDEVYKMAAIRNTIVKCTKGLIYYRGRGGTVVELRTTEQEVQGSNLTTAVSCP